MLSQEVSEKRAYLLRAGFAFGDDGLGFLVLFGFFEFGEEGEFFVGGIVVGGGVGGFFVGGGVVGAGVGGGVGGDFGAACDAVDAGQAEGGGEGVVGVCGVGDGAAEHLEGGETRVCVCVCVCVRGRKR